MAQQEITYGRKEDIVPVSNRSTQVVAADLNEIKQKVTANAQDAEVRLLNVEENQYSGVAVYSTFADLPNPGTILVSYKVSNDSDFSKNGYYHWDGTQYIKDAEISDAVTQDQLGDIQKGIVELSGIVFTDGYFIDATNGIYGSGTSIYAATEGFIDCKNAKRIRVNVPIYNTDTVVGVAFYDSNQIFISGITRPLGTIGKVNILYDVPEDAVYFRMTYFDSTNSGIYGDYKIEIIYSEGENISELLYDEMFLIDGKNVDAVTGVNADSSVLSCTGFLSVEDAIEIEFTELHSSNVSDKGIAFYDQNYIFLYGYKRGVQGDNGFSVKKYLLASEVKFVKLSYWNREGRELYSSPFYMKLYFDKQKDKKNYQTERVVFEIPVNQNFANNSGTDNILQDSEVFEYPVANVLLPINYDPNGEPVRALMVSHGLKGNVTYDEWYRNVPTWLTMMQYYAEAGYAVFDICGTRNITNDDFFYDGYHRLPNLGCPGVIAGFKHTHDFIVRNFNVEDSMFVVGYSQGGIAALNMSNIYRGKVRALAMLEAFSDLKLEGWTNQSDIREYFGELYNFDNPTSVYEDEKTLGYDVRKRIYNNGGNDYLTDSLPPLKGIYGNTGSAITANVIISLINSIKLSGGKADLRTINSADHTITAGAYPVAYQEAVMWFNRF